MVEKVAMSGGLRRLVVVAAAERTDPGKAVTNIGGVGNLAESSPSQTLSMPVATCLATISWTLVASRVSKAG